MQNPWLNCTQLAELLKEEAIRISPISVHKLLVSKGWSKRNARLAEAERLLFSESTGVFPEITQELRQALESFNPRLRCWEALNRRSGSHWYLDLARLPGTWWKGEVALLLAIDGRSGYAFAEVGLVTLEISDLERMLGRVFEHSQQSWHSINGIIINRNLIKIKTKIKNIINNCIQQSQYIKPSIDIDVDDNSGFPWIQNFIEWMRLQPKTFHGRREMVGLQIEEEVNQWLSSYNLAFHIPGFPHFGRTPRELWDLPVKEFTHGLLDEMMAQNNTIWR
jgi:hypothetical protein